MSRIYIKYDKEIENYILTEEFNRGSFILDDKIYIDDSKDGLALEYYYPTLHKTLIEYKIKQRKNKLSKI